MDDVSNDILEFNYEQFLLVAANKRMALTEMWRGLFNHPMQEGFVDKSLESLSLSLSDTQNMVKLIEIARGESLSTFTVLLPYALDSAQLDELSEQGCIIEQRKNNLQDCLHISL
uniref:hypothetical protein n=1 Tax=Thaumasiovibrio occultus TaxID=1891184 RepID=UPI000B359299|nr:hypothetical protein [Thaumasiovibrio occultus]